MKGLIKSNLYASLSNIKMFAVIIILIGIAAVGAVKEVPTLMINYSLISMVGFSLNAIGGIQKENTSKWKKYKLTAPVKRADIVKSYYLCHIVWLFTGIVFDLLFIGLSAILHGYGHLFDKRTDILMIFTAGICIALLVGAIFFPVFYAGGSERYEATWTISILCAIGIFMGAIAAVNFWFSPMTELTLAITAVIFIAVSAFIFILSFLLSVGIFRRKEY